MIVLELSFDSRKVASAAEAIEATCDSGLMTEPEAAEAAMDVLLQSALLIEELP